MSEILRQRPEEIEQQPKIKVPDVGIEKDVKYFEKEKSKVSDEGLSLIMESVRSEIIELIKSEKISSYEKVQEAENEFLEKVNNPDKKLLVEILFGIVFTNIRAIERENKKTRSRQGRNKSKEENVEWGNLIKKFVDKYGDRSEMLKIFWNECGEILGDIPNKAKEFKRRENPFEIKKTGILAELAAMRIFKEMGLKVEQASAKDDLNNKIDLVVKFKDKSNKLQTVPVQIKYTIPEEKGETLKFCTKFELLQTYNDFRNNGKDIREIDRLKQFMIGCINYERQQMCSGENIFLNAGIFMNLRAEGPNKIDDGGNIIDEKLKKDIKEELELRLSL